MRDAKTMKGRGMVLTTTNKARLDEVLGEDSHAQEVVGRPRDLREIDSAIKAETRKAETAIPPEARGWMLSRAPGSVQKSRVSGCQIVLQSEILLLWSVDLSSINLPSVILSSVKIILRPEECLIGQRFRVDLLH
jgi:hypothetical protein